VIRPSFIDSERERERSEKEKRDGWCLEGVVDVECGVERDVERGVERGVVRQRSGLSKNVRLRPNGYQRSVSAGRRETSIGNRSTTFIVGLEGRKETKLCSRGEL